MATLSDEIKALTGKAKSNTLQHEDNEVGEEIIHVDVEDNLHKVRCSNPRLRTLFYIIWKFDLLLLVESKSTRIVSAIYSKEGEVMLKLHAEMTRFAHRLCPQSRCG